MIVAVTSIICLAVIVSVLIVTRAVHKYMDQRILLEEARLKERDETEWEALKADVAVWQQKVRDLRSGIAIRGGG